MLRSLLFFFLGADVQHDARELRLEAGVESSDVHALVPEQRVEQHCLCWCAGKGAADIIIDITDALAVALFFAVALEGDARVARGLERTAGRRQRDLNRAAAKQRQGGGARLGARPERHFVCFFTFRAAQKRPRRWRRRREQRRKGLQLEPDPRPNETKSKLTREAKASAATAYELSAGGNVIKK